MQLTAAERWLLINQYRLMQMLADRPVPHYEEAITILSRGYEKHYPYASQYLREAPLPTDVANEVENILSMFSQIQWVKDRITDESIFMSPRFAFWGFDGNNNPLHLEYANFLHSMGQFKDLGDRLTWNSHSDTIGTYRAMVQAWENLARQGLQMTQEDVRKIIDAPAGK